MMIMENKEKTKSRPFLLYIEEEMGKFPHFIVCAILEWIVIILLFSDGLLAFASNEFARFFDLRIPCLLCTRIDHNLVHRHPDFYYNDSICETHKKNVSSLAYCHNHKKLSDIRKMCETCLLSFATENESDCDSYKSLVGILHKDLECFVEDDHQVLSLPSGKKDELTEMEKSDLLRCSCCGVSLKVRPTNSSSNGGRNVGALSQAPAPSPRAGFFARKNSNDSRVENRSLELPHIRYTELKFSEITEDDSAGSNERNPSTQLREDPKAATVPSLTEAEEVEANRTPNPGKGNRFFGIPLDSANNSPRGAIRISKRPPLERTEFSPRSADLLNSNNSGSNPQEDIIDSDSILLRLKRQVRLDRKYLMALYMELDEERSASAVAANNAMAMITKLQAEKAAVQMEALQYQRMMEEQAEYDQEAFQATNDLLVKREDDLKVIEAELEAYRDNKYGTLKYFEFKRSEDEPGIEINQQEFNNNTNNKAQPDLSAVENSKLLGTILSETDKEKRNTIDQVVSSTLPHIEDLNELLKLKTDKTYLLGRLKRTDEKSTLSFPDEGVQSFLSSSESANHIDEETEKVGGKSAVTKELFHLNERVKALEAAAQMLEKHSEGTRILNELSQNLQKLQSIVDLPLEDTKA